MPRKLLRFWGFLNCTCGNLFCRVPDFEYVIDGYCLWDSNFTDFKVTNTPFGMDVINRLAGACRRRNMPLCLYYSTIDNDHPSYPHRGGAYEKARSEPGDRANMSEYLAFVRSQVEELAENGRRASDISDSSTYR